jgi:nicotinamidase-related amidase/membrane protein YdbS with pleckstrin-like domain
VEETARAQRQTQTSLPPLTPKSFAESVDSTTPSPLAPAQNKKKNRIRISGWAGFKQVLVEIVLRLPGWVFPLIWLLKLSGFAFYLAQIPFTYAVRRLDYELRWYIVTDRSLRIRTGLVRLQESTMSFANLQQVEVKQDPIQRLLGLADVHVQSAGGGGDRTHGRGEVGDSLHTGVFHSVENAAEIRDLILERLRQFRQTGLGDPDDHADHAVVPAVPPPREELAANADALAAARDVLAEARALRQILPQKCFRSPTLAAAFTLIALGLGSASSAGAALPLTLQSRVETKAGSGEFRVVVAKESWAPKETAIIVCDMWDLHHCKNAVRREAQMAPRMNELLEKARAQGVFIIHAPSSCMKPYEGHAARGRAQTAPKAANLPADIGQWCKQIPAEEKGKYPIEHSDSEDDDPVEHAQWAAELKAKGLDPKKPWTRQIDVLKIRDEDAISDSGVEIWNLIEQRGIKNVILMGVHVNMCVSGRPFGLRQMVKNGKHAVLMRDMTDSMYNPKQWPYVDHFTGTALYIEHVERYIAPTITSDQILGGQPFTFAGAAPMKR